MERDNMVDHGHRRSRFGFRARGLIAVLLAAVLAAACEDKPTLTPKEFIERAEQHRQKGQYRAGIIQIKNALQQDPNNVDARVVLGRIYLEAGDAVAAADELLRAKEFKADLSAYAEPLGRALIQNNKFKDVFEEVALEEGISSSLRAVVSVLHGYAYAGLGNGDKAQEAFRTALALDSGYAGAYVGMARLFVARNESEQADLAAETAAGIDPDHVDVLSLQGDLAFLREDFETAASYYQRIADKRKDNPIRALVLANAQIGAGQIDAASQNVERASKVLPDHPSVLFLKALLALESKDYQTAQNAIEQVLSVDPDHMRSRLVAGISSYALEHYERALQHLELYLAFNSNDVLARRMSIAALNALGRDADAYEMAKPLADDGDSDADVLALVGALAVGAGELAWGEQYLMRAIEQKPDDAQLRSNLGLTRVSLGRTAEGADDLESAFEMDSDLDESAIVLFSTYLREERYERAMRLAKSIQETKPNHPAGPTLVAFVHLAQKEYEAAREAFLKAVERNPSIERVNYNLANIDLILGQYERAEDVLAQGLERAPDSSQLMVQMAKVQALLNKPEEQEKWLRRALDVSGSAAEPVAAMARYHLDSGDSERSAAVAREGLNRFPDDPGLLKIAGQAQLWSGDASAAAATFRKLVQKEPQEVHNHFLLATSYLNLGDLERTSTSLNQVLRLNPNHLASKAFLVRLLVERKELDDAKALLAELKELAPDSYPVVRAQAAVELAENRTADAISSLKQVVDLPGAASYRLPVLLAALEWQAGSLDESAARLEQWLEKAPRDWRALLMLAAQYVDRNELGKARDAYKTAVELQPDSWLAWSALGWTFVRLGEVAEAEEPIGAALELAPDQPRVLATAGLYHLETGSYDRAIEFLDRAASELQADPDVQYQFARALAEVGRDSEATEVLTKALAIEGRFLDRSKAKRLLTGLQAK